QLLLLRRRQKRQRGSNEVHKAPRIFDVQRNRLQLVRQGRRGGDDLLELRRHVTVQRLDLRALRRRNLGDWLYRGGHERLELVEFAQPHALRAFGEDKQALVGHLDYFVYG